MSKSAEEIVDDFARTAKLWTGDLFEHERAALVALIEAGEQLRELLREQGYTGGRIYAYDAARRKAEGEDE